MKLCHFLVCSHLFCSVRGVFSSSDLCVAHQEVLPVRAYYVICVRLKASKPDLAREVNIFGICHDTLSALQLASCYVSHGTIILQVLQSTVILRTWAGGSKCRPATEETAQSHLIKS